VASFDVCLSWVLDSEDRNRTWASNPDLPPGARAIAGVNSHVFPSEYAAIAAKLQAERGPAVYSFYRTHFWNGWYGQLTSTEVAKRVLDSAVNQGPGTAVKLLQEAIANLSGIIAVDGLWGVLTVQRANLLDADRLVEAFKTVRIAAYKAIGGPDLKDWLARAAR